VTTDIDPFVSHPERRDKVCDPLTSFARNFVPSDWRYTDSQREEMRRETFARHPADHPWAFAYGSLMWDPGIRFAEVRGAHLIGYVRRFLLKDVYGARGTLQTPGLLAALARGEGCDGLVFRILKEHAYEETEVLWRRKMPLPGYVATFCDVETAAGSGPALGFVADYALEHDPHRCGASSCADSSLSHGMAGSCLTS